MSDAGAARAVVLQDESLQVRWASARSLWAIGPAAAAAAPYLVESLTDKEWVMRWSAARAIGAVASEEHLALTVPALANALTDRDSRVCEAAAFALEQMGVVAEAALPALSRAVSAEQDSAAQTGTCQVIDVGPAIEELLMHTGWTVRWAAVRALGVVGKGNRDALPSLTLALIDAEWQVRGGAALAIGPFGTASTSRARSALADKRRDENRAGRTAVDEGAGAGRGCVGVINTEARPDDSQA